MRYRSRMDIIAAILETAKEGAIKTKIMYRAFLSFPQLKEYLHVLMDGGLLEYSEEAKMYNTTEKGRHFLEMYSEVGDAISPKDSSRKKKAVAAKR